jgi:type I restriction enzyme S subunit
MTVVVKTLGSVIDLFNGKSPPKDTEGEFPIYGSNGRIGYAKSFNQKNAIILGRVGAYCGSVELCSDRFWASDNTIVVKPKDGQNLTYLYYRLKSSPLRNYAGGAAQPLLTQSILRGVKIPLIEELSQQTKIATILSAYDDLIENNRRRMALLEEAARLLYREWFVYLRFPGYERHRIVDGVPDGWERNKLFTLCEKIDYGYTASSERENVGPKFLRITDIVPSFIEWPSVPYCTIQDTKIEKYRLYEGDIVIARTGATVGYAKRLNKLHPDAVFASYLIRIRLKSDIDNLMVGVFIESDMYKNFVKSHVGGAAQPNANAKILTSVEILIPPFLIQRRFRQLVEPLIDQCEILQIQNVKLREARDLLLPRLMNGEITI